LIFGQLGVGRVEWLRQLWINRHTEYEGKAVVGKVDVDANQEFAAKYGVRNIPTVLVFKNGEVVDKQVGVAPKNVYTGKIDAAL